MKALVVSERNSVLIQEVPYPKCDEDSVVIKVMASGLCGTDYHICDGTYPATYPLIPGHEFSGIIDKVGVKVSEFMVGDRVTADPNIYCGECYYCKRDQENMCENANATGVTLDGGFAEYVSVPARQLYKLPDDMSFIEGAMIEPISCVVYAMKRLQLSFGDKAIVFGCGPMGMLLLQALKIGGASEVVGFDVSEGRLESAKDYADSVYSDMDQLKRNFHRGFDVVIDATGNTGVIQDMFKVAAKRAKILQFGCSNSDKSIQFNPFNLYDNDWQYIGTRALLFTFIQAIEMIKNKKIDTSKIVNNVVTLEGVLDCLQGRRPSNALKTVFSAEASS